MALRPRLAAGLPLSRNLVATALVYRDAEGRSSHPLGHDDGRADLT
jgi:hypothetical protein